MSVENIENIIHKVLNKIKPGDEEKLRFCQIFTFIKDNLTKCINNILNTNYIEITLQGSVAKDTFLKNQSDIDVFLLFPTDKGITINWFEQTLIPIIIKCFNNYKYILKYASHPYITIYIDSVEVNIVPAYKVSSPDKIISAVDRTPFHTEYIKSHLNETQKDEVRILKQFLKNWDLYGAEIEIQGFSGYLAELLIIAYGNFHNLLRNTLRWQAYRTCIDIENHYSSNKECLERFKRNVLVVVDPVDPKRNAAAAVSIKKFSMFKLLAKMLLEHPSEVFFFDYSNITKDVNNAFSYIENRLKSFDSCLYLLIFEVLKPIPDMIWGQLYRLKNSLLNVLRTYTDNKYIYADIWFDKENLRKAILVIEHMYCNKQYKIHVGPYAFDVTNAMSFLIKNISSDVGPWVGDDGRIYSFKFISKNDITRVIINAIMSTSISGMIFKDLNIITSASDLHLIKHKYTINTDFIYWLKQFLERKPFKKIYSIFKTED